LAIIMCQERIHSSPGPMRAGCDSGELGIELHEGEPTEDRLSVGGWVHSADRLADLDDCDPTGDESAAEDSRLERRRSASTMSFVMAEASR